MKHFKLLKDQTSKKYQVFKNSWVQWIGFNIYDYSDFQQKIRGDRLTLHTVGMKDAVKSL